MSVLAAPATSVARHHRLQDLITELHARHTSLTDGHVATYIPELGKANPEHFGVCVVTAEGEVLSAGDCKPVKGAVVEVWQETPGLGYVRRGRASVVTSATGAFRNSH